MKIYLCDVCGNVADDAAAARAIDIDLKHICEECYGAIENKKIEVHWAFRNAERQAIQDVVDQIRKSRPPMEETIRLLLKAANKENEK